MGRIRSPPVSFCLFSIFRRRVFRFQVSSCSVGNEASSVSSFLALFCSELADYSDGGWAICSCYFRRVRGNWYLSSTSVLCVSALTWLCIKPFSVTLCGRSKAARKVSKMVNNRSVTQKVLEQTFGDTMNKPLPK